VQRLYAKIMVSGAILALIPGCAVQRSPDELIAENRSQPQAIEARLYEWRIELSANEVKSGPVLLRVENHGTTEHEIVVLKTDIQHRSLPIRDGRVSESTAGEVLTEFDEMSPGHHEEKLLDLSPGTYVLFCNIVSTIDGIIRPHYLSGMSAELTVK